MTDEELAAMPEIRVNRERDTLLIVRVPHAE